MIIQIRGTSGSGKTTVMREVMKALGEWTPTLVHGRKKPLYYKRGPYCVLGHYESTCGGCDNVGSARHVFELIESLDSPYIICEGLLLSEDTKWTYQMENVYALFLSTPLEECLRRVGERRKQAGNDKPLNPKNTTNRIRVIEKARKKLLLAEVNCRRASSGQASGIILRWLHAKGIENGSGS